jgi:hypothetical protein
MSIKESSDKLMEGINFLLRGLRLLASDVGNAGGCGFGGWGQGAGLGPVILYCTLAAGKVAGTCMVTVKPQAARGIQVRVA